MDVFGTSSVFVLRAVCLVSVLGVPVSLESLGTVTFPCLLELESMNLDLNCRDLELVSWR